MMQSIERVLIVGGTHGNELTGVYVVEKFRHQPELIARSSFVTETLLANPGAIELGKRYVETDLNRCFQRSDLVDETLNSYEAQRAKEIYATFGEGGTRSADVILDLHTTTANMGLTLILASSHPFNLRMAAFVVAQYPAVKVIYSPMRDGKAYLDAISPFGCTIEVGAIAQNVLDAKLFEATEKLVHCLLDYLEGYNRSPKLPETGALTVYRVLETVDYPRDENGRLRAMVHPQRQGRDFEPLNPGDPMFLTFGGETLTYRGTATVYPIFINEAAYYEKGIAMTLTEPRSLDLA